MLAAAAGILDEGRAVLTSAGGAAANCSTSVRPPITTMTRVTNSVAESIAMRGPLTDGEPRWIAGCAGIITARDGTSAASD